MDKTILILGDTHGRLNWKQIISNNPIFDKLIFVGDYFDTHDNVSAEQQMNNFKDIIQFKNDNPGKVIMLIGNHDHHYFPEVGYSGTSGYQSGAAPAISMLLDDNRKHLQMCYIHEKYLITHAGVTKTWCENNNIDLDNLEESINELWKYKPNAFRFTQGKYRDNYGDEICQTPIWVRPHSLGIDKIDGYTQIIGHTTQSSIRLNNNIILIDTLGTSGEYLKIIDNQPEVGN